MVPRTQPPPRPILERLYSGFSQRSFISPTPSIEGDDEDSSVTTDDMEEGGAFGAAESPEYQEDSRPTSRKELAGWYSYGWAAEVFAICAMASFLPITLEQLARDRGVRLDDHSIPCSSTWGEHEGSGRLLSLTRSLPQKPTEPPACIVTVLGMHINTASFALYTFSFSVLVQALLIISMSGAADHGKSRKSFLLALGVTGAISTMLFIVVVPSVYLLGALLAIISNTCFGASFVLLNSFLPLLVRHHPSIIRLRRRSSVSNSLERTTSAEENDLRETAVTRTLLQDQIPLTKSGTISPELALSTKISSQGIGIGYIASLFVQSMAILLVLGTGQTTFSLRLVLFIIGSWWLLFSIPAALWLRPRPGSPLPAAQQAWTSYFVHSWRSLGLTIVRARRMKDVVIFLAAWFLLSDGIATVSGTAILFAKTTLGMETWALALINVISTIAGVCGAFSWSYISRVFGLKASQTIIACMFLFELIPLYGLLGFIPAVRRLGVLGLQEPWEMYPLGAIYGFVLGGLSSYCRSFFGELIPPGSEAAFYALYAITDKGSSIFGPAIVGLITDRYGEIRPAFVFLAVLIAMPLPLMLMVDVERGKRDAQDMAQVFKTKDLNIREGGGRAGYQPVPSIGLDEDRQN